MTKSLSDQVKDLENTRAAKAARMVEVMQKPIDEGRSTDAAEAEEFDMLEAEVKSIDSDLIRLRQLEKMQQAKAMPAGGNSFEEGSKSRSGIDITVKSNLPKGTAFTRYVQALARARGNVMQAAEIAKQWHDSTPEVEMVLKAAVSAGTTTDSDWAAPLVPYQQMTSEFIELLRPATLLGRISGFRNVPFNVRIPSQTQGSSVAWVGETKPKPVSELKFADITMRFTKVAGIVVISEELAKLSTPSAEAIIRGDLVAQIAQFLDEAFIDPANAEVANVSPASVTNGAQTVAASGTDAAAVRADIFDIFAPFVANNLSISDAVWVTTPSIALALGMMQNALGQNEFPGLTVNGGSFMGLPILVSNSVPHDTSGGLLVLIKPSEILLADEGGVTIDVSREASLQMDSVPDDVSSGGTNLVSLWQNNLVGIRAERMINWKKRRSQAAVYISGALYGQAGS